jgi:hypothetical protein
LKKKFNKWYDTVSRTIEFENGVQQLSICTIPEHKLQLFKNELISKGYSEEDLEKLLDLARENFENERTADEAD